ncbi:MAG: hypothetical protein AAF483_00410, partial [Planctomycetota bacterium]
MSKRSSGSDRDATSATVLLQPDHRDLLVDLILAAHEAETESASSVRQALSACIAGRSEFKGLLCDGLRRALADSDYLKAWIEQLRRLRKTVLPFQELEEDFVKQMLDAGPEGIEDLGQLA